MVKKITQKKPPTPKKKEDPDRTELNAIAEL
jgi:hypothetical protein